MAKTPVQTPPKAAAKRAAKKPPSAPAGPDVARLCVEQRPLAEIRPYERNARKIPQTAVDKVAASIQAFGWRQPIVVDRKGVIVAGHARLLAAQKLGLATAPVHVAADLSPAEIRAYRIADNRTNEESAWDEELLRIELGDLQESALDLTLTGFSPLELAAHAEETPDVEFREFDESIAAEVKMIRCPKCGHEFPQ